MCLWFELRTSREKPSKKSANESPPARLTGSSVNRPSKTNLPVIKPALKIWLCSPESRMPELYRVPAFGPSDVGRDLPRLRLDEVEAATADAAEACRAEAARAGRRDVEPIAQVQPDDRVHRNVIGVGYVRVDVAPAGAERAYEIRRPDAVVYQRHLPVRDVNVFALQVKTVRTVRQARHAPVVCLLAADAKVNIVRVVNALVVAQVPAVQVLGPGRDKDVVPRAPAVRRRRPPVARDPRDSVDAAVRNYVIWERIAGPGIHIGRHRVTDDVLLAREIAGPLDQVGNRVHARGRLADVGKFHVSEEEGLVLLDRAAYRKPVLVAL